VYCNGREKILEKGAVMEEVMTSIVIKQEFRINEFLDVCFKKKLGYLAKSTLDVINCYS
jgi:hypothetical protein